jgi:hypothetical protein
MVHNVLVLGAVADFAKQKYEKKDISTVRLGGVFFSKGQCP